MTEEGGQSTPLLPLPWPYPTKIDSQDRFLGYA